MGSTADGFQNRQVTVWLAHFIVEQEGWLSQKHAAGSEYNPANIFGQVELRVQPVQVSRNAAHNGIRRNPLIRIPFRKKFYQAGERQRFQVPLSRHTSKER